MEIYSSINLIYSIQSLGLYCVGAKKGPAIALTSGQPSQLSDSGGYRTYLKILQWDFDH